VEFVQVGIGLAVLAAIGYGLSSVMQALGARQATAASDGTGMTTASGSPTLRSTLAAAVTGVVILGALMDVLGFAAGAGAARMLPLFLSQTIVAGNLVITAVLGALLLGIRLHGRDWAAMVLVIVALCMLGTASHAHGATHADLPFKLGLLIATVAIITISLLVVRRLGHAGSVVAGMSAGLLFGAIAIAVRVLGGISPFSITTILADPAAWTIAVAGAFGFYLHTVALQLGAVNGSTAAMVVGETAVPGVWLLGDTTVPGLGWLGALGFLLAVLGAVLVALFGSSEAERSATENEMHPLLAPEGSPSTCTPATNG
jgi:drug/metabolite transporter (DMT)-like permease